MQSRSLWSPDDQQCPFNMSAFPESGRQITKNQGELGSANGRGCVKTQNRPLEIVSKLGEFSVEVSCLLTGRYRLVSQSIASYVVFADDFWGETVPEFSHSLSR